MMSMRVIALLVLSGLVALSTTGCEGTSSNAAPSTTGCSFSEGNVALSTTGCVPTQKPTKEPIDEPITPPTEEETTRAPTRTPTASPTRTPTIDNLQMSNNLLALLDSSAFLERINGLVSPQIPNTLTFEKSVGMKQSPIEMKASLKSCTGLNSVRIKGFSKMGEAITKDSSGNYIVSLSADLAMDGVTCTGDASAEANLGFWKPEIDAEHMSATVQVNKFAPVIQGKIEEKGGQMCLSVEDVRADVRQADIRFTDVNFKFASIGALTVPQTLIDTVWKMLPLDDVITSLRNTVLPTVQTLLQAIEKCISV